MSVQKKSNKPIFLEGGPIKMRFFDFPRLKSMWNNAFCRMTADIVFDYDVSNIYHQSCIEL